MPDHFRGDQKREYRMSSYSSFLASLMLLPIGINVLFPEKSEVGPFFLLVGFALIISTTLLSAARQHAHGIFSQWTDPKEFIGMKLNAREVLFFKCGVACALGGILVMVKAFL